MTVTDTNTFADEFDSDGRTESDGDSASYEESDEESEEGSEEEPEEGSEESFDEDDNPRVRKHVEYFNGLGQESESESESEEELEDSEGVFENEGSVGSESTYHSEDDDEESGSESGSGSGSESGSESGSGSDLDESSDSDDDNSSGSEDESSRSGSDEKSYRDPFVDEQENARGIGSGMNSSMYDRYRRWYVIGLGVFCFLLLAVAIGLGVGLSTRDKDKNDDKEGSKAPTPIVTLPPGSAPTNPPVRMPISLPNPPKIDEIVTDDVEVVAEIIGTTTIYLDGDLKESANGSESTMLVQRGLPSDEIPSAYSLIELAVDAESVQYILSPTFNATFCLQHVPNDEPSDRVATYSACLIDGGGLDVDELTGATANYVMPNNCLNQVVESFVVSPADTEVCIDVTDEVFQSLMSGLSVRRGLRGKSGGSGDHYRSLQGDQNNLVMMIGNTLVPAAQGQPGDQFYTSNNEDSEKWPSLILKGEKKVECETIADIVCSDLRFSTLCSLVQATQWDVIFGDNRAILTVFAPDDEAIAKAMAEGLDTSNIDFVNELLMYHTVFGALVESTDIDCNLLQIPPLRMANAKPTNITCDQDDIFIAGGGNLGDELPKIIDADIVTCNGIIHAINEVILPATGSLDYEENKENPVVGEDIVLSETCQTVDALLCSNDDLSMMCQLITTGTQDDDTTLSQLFESLNIDVFTMFMPNNEAAFGALSLGLDTSDSNAILDVLWYHVVPNVTLFAKDLECDGELKMTNGGITTTVCDGDSLFQVGKGNIEAKPQIVISDLETCTGVIHIVDKIILPGELIPTDMITTGVSQTKEGNSDTTLGIRTL